MKILATTGVVKGKYDAIAVFLFDDEVSKVDLSCVDRKTNKELLTLIAASKFTGKKDELLLHYSPLETMPRIILQGLGSRKEFQWQTLRLGAGAVVRAARDSGAKTLAMMSTDKVAEDLAADRVTRALVEGLVLGDWRFDYYRNLPKKEIKDISTVTIFYVSQARVKSAQAMIPVAQTLADCQNLARDYGTHPSNVVNTEFLAAEARKLSKRGIKVTVLEKAQLTKLGMNLLLAVGRGSAMPPKLIIMDYNPRGAKKCFAFVGKGMVFDSGGLNIKTASMEEMKSDMCGAGTVLATMYGVAELKPKHRVIGILAAVENAVGPDAYRPSDIYTAYNGKTVEVMNTDAEGRLVLADALAYAVRNYKPNAIVDVATLTGAAVVALGQMCDAIFSNNDYFRRSLQDAAERADERVWHMPIFEEHSKDMKGECAELRNFPGHRWGGCCTAAAFLQEFVDHTPWVHIDIAPTAFPGLVSSIQPKSAAAGSAVRTLLELVTGK